MHFYFKSISTRYHMMDKFMSNQLSNSTDDSFVNYCLIICLSFPAYNIKTCIGNSAQF